jgi:hypothetical protein
MFDPYRKWLGIPEEHRPPTHYQLLGIAPDERDIEVIEAAVLRQSAFVRNFQSGQHADDASRLLNEIAAARICLVDATKRTKYDAELRKKQPKPAASSPARHSDPSLPIPAGEVVGRPSPPAPLVDLQQISLPAPQRAAPGRRLPASGAPTMGRRRTPAAGSVGYVWQVPLVTVVIILLMLLARLIGHSIAEQRALYSRPSQQVEQPETE